MNGNRSGWAAMLEDVRLFGYLGINSLANVYALESDALALMQFGRVIVRVTYTDIVEVRKTNVEDVSLMRAQSFNNWPFSWGILIKTKRPGLLSAFTITPNNAAFTADLQRAVRLGWHDTPTSAPSP